MDKTNGHHDSEPSDTEYRKFIWSRYIVGILITIVLVVGTGYLIRKLTPSGESASIEKLRVASREEHPKEAANREVPETSPIATAPASDKPSAEHAVKSPAPSSSSETPAAPHGTPSPDVTVAAGPPGTTFVEAVAKPLDYELTKRFWGWRPNDIVNLTDNVNELQLGVLEVTRRATVILTDRLSRRGSAEAIDPNLERAMNWLMIKAESYWFPAPENKYAEAVTELRIYKEKLNKGSANFYTRTDNLIPLLRSFEELLGSCDDSLVKQLEDDGDRVSTFQADNYYFYAKGVATAMYSILKAVEHDFEKTLEVRGGTDLLHHAIESCHHAAELDPWFMVTEANLNGVLANHRANMAAPISHARFYVDILIETLST